jgi:hypothetical protein
VVLCGDEDNYGQSALVHLTARLHVAVVGEHLHPQSPERFWVISGRLGTRIVAWSAPWWPARIGVAGHQGVPGSVSEVVPGSR